MMRTRVKFCGITRQADADAAVALGVDALGFVFAPGSPRRVATESAQRIRQSLPPFVAAVILVMNQPQAEVAEIIAAMHPDFVQFHGEENADFCMSFGRPYFRVVPMGDGPQALREVAQAHPQARALLLDSHARGLRGGTGERFDWSRPLEVVRQPLILAGGLHPGNVAAAIEHLRPFAVDVSSGIEQAPGHKDSGKMADFLRATRTADGARH